MNIKVIGIGGAGSNLAQELYQKQEAISINIIDTDAADLKRKLVPEKFFIGNTFTKGLSTGGDCGVGKKIADKEKNVLAERVQGVDCLFLSIGLGGGTGTAIAPTLADLAKKQGAFVIAFAFLPFSMEGIQRSAQAELGLAELRKYSDAVICLPNDLMLQQIDVSSTVLEAFSLANEWVKKGIIGIVNSLLKTGIINLDLNAIKQTLPPSSGRTLYGLSVGEGTNAADEAIANFAVCPLLHTPQTTQFAESLLINITGSPELSLHDVNKIVTYMNSRFSSKKNSLVGAVIDETFTNNRIEICVIGMSEGPNQALSRKNTKNRLKESPHQQVLFFDDPTLSQKNTGDANAATSGGDYFGQMGKNMYRGQDLDIPTYLRKGIKIRL